MKTEDFKELTAFEQALLVELCMIRKALERLSEEVNA